MRHFIIYKNDNLKMNSINFMNVPFPFFNRNLDQNESPTILYQIYNDYELLNIKLTYRIRREEKRRYNVY